MVASLSSSSSSSFQIAVSAGGVLLDGGVVLAAIATVTQ